MNLSHLSPFLHSISFSFVLLDVAPIFLLFFSPPRFLSLSLFHDRSRSIFLALALSCSFHVAHRRHAVVACFIFPSFLGLSSNVTVLSVGGPFVHAPDPHSVPSLQPGSCSNGQESDLAVIVRTRRSRQSPLCSLSLSLFPFLPPSLPLSLSLSLSLSLFFPLPPSHPLSLSHPLTLPSIL